jgi:hypothetical protein
MTAAIPGSVVLALLLCLNPLVASDAAQRNSVSAAGEPREAPAVADPETPAAPSETDDFGTDETGQEQDDFDKPFWNVWQEDSGTDSPNYKPIRMEADHSYLVVVDLASLAYQQFDSGVFSTETNNDFDNWLKQNNHDLAKLNVLALPDERFFEPLPGADRVHPFLINLKKMREARKHPYRFRKNENPFALLAKGSGDVPFDFGQVAFVVKTKKGVHGNGAIAFSFWDEDDKPVTELSYSTCIRGPGQQPCEPADIPNYSVIGVDTNVNHSMPDAALHFVELNSETLIGVFRCNTCGWGRYDFKQWRLAGGSRWFHDQFLLTILPGIRLAANGPDNPNPASATLRPLYSEKTLNNASDSLYRLLFPAGEASEAETAFQDFVSRAVAHPPPNGGVAPSLFIRLLPQHAENGFVVPLGLTRVPLPDGRREFLGFHFRIQTPLRLQDYSEHGACLSNWVLLMPPLNLFAGNPLILARRQFADWIDTFQADQLHAKLYQDVDAFKNWVSPDQTKDANPENYAVMILSHHDSNSLFLDRSISSIFAPVVAKSFGNPSVAIIDACGTANPGAFEFVKDFNNHGVYTVVASSVEVDARMGGDFLATLVNAIDHHSSEQRYMLDQAVFDAILGLRDQPDGSGKTAEPYGSRALVYGLLGNGEVRLCVPSKPKPVTAGGAGLGGGTSPPK